MKDVNKPQCGCCIFLSLNDDYCITEMFMSHAFMLNQFHCIDVLFCPKKQISNICDFLLNVFLDNTRIQWPSTLFTGKITLVHLSKRLLILVNNDEYVGSCASLSSNVKPLPDLLATLPQPGSLIMRILLYTQWDMGQRLRKRHDLQCVCACDYCQQS